MYKLEQAKKDFMEQVNTSHISYDWDACWCYSYIDHPLMNTEFEEKDSQEAWEDFHNSWLSDNEEPLYNVMDEEGNTLVGHGETLTGEEAKEYAEGLISLLKRFANPTSATIERLQHFLDSQEFEQKVLTT